MDDFDLALQIFLAALRKKYISSEIKIEISNEWATRNGTEYRPMLRIQTDMELTTLNHMPDCSLNNSNAELMDKVYRDMADEGMQILLRKPETEK